MPSPSASERPAVGETRRTLLSPVIVLVGLAAMGLVGVYLAWPWLIAAVAARLAAPMGLDALSLRVGRPGIDGMTVEAVELVAGRVEVSAEGGRVGYRLGNLPAGRLETVEFRRARIRLAAPEAGKASAPGPAGEPPDLATVFAALPAERVVVEQLEVVVPALTFEAVGRVTVDRDRLKLDLVGLTPPEADGLHLQVTAHAAGDIDARLTERGAERPPVVDVRTTLQGRRLALEGEVSLSGLALDLATVLAGLPPGEGTVAGRFSGHLPWPLPVSGDWSGATGQGRLLGDWRHPKEDWSLSDVRLDWRLQDRVLTADVAASLEQAGRRMALQARIQRFDAVEASAAGTLTVKADPERATLAELTWAIRPDRLELAGTFRADAAVLEWLPEEARVPGRGTLTGRLAAALPRPLPDDWQSLDPTAEGTLTGQWRLPGMALGFDDLKGAWRLEDSRLTGRVAAAVQHRDLGLAVALEIDALEPVGERVAARGTAVLGDDGVRVPFVLDHRPGTGAGSLEAEAAQRVEAPLAGALVEGWREPYDVVGGELGLEAKLRWPVAGSVGGTVAITLNGLDVHYQDVRIAGLHGNLEVAAAADGSWSLTPAPLRIDAIDTGVLLEDLETVIAWSGDRLSVDGVSSRLLGGRAGIAPFAHRISTGRADFVVDLTDVDLARVLELEGGHVTGTGTLHGSLPVRLRDNVPSVVAGEIRAEPPGGTIRVSPALAAGTGQPGLDFALRALRDFRYTVLEADVAYTGEGDLTLGVRLQGRNPDVEQGRPIHYNLTVTENVPTLLRSLRLQDDVTREIERRVTD